MKTPKRTPEYAAFENLLRNVLTVSHSELKLRMDADKQEKRRKRAKISHTSRASSDKD